MCNEWRKLEILHCRWNAGGVSFSELKILSDEPKAEKPHRSCLFWIYWHDCNLYILENEINPVNDHIYLNLPLYPSLCHSDCTQIRSVANPYFRLFNKASLLLTYHLIDSSQILEIFTNVDLEMIWNSRKVKGWRGWNGDIESSWRSRAYAGSQMLNPRECDRFERWTQLRRACGLIHEKHSWWLHCMQSVRQTPKLLWPLMTTAPWLVI